MALSRPSAPSFAVTALFTALAALSAFPAAAAPPTGGDSARMVVEAKELVYDEKKNTVSARGDVQIYYKGRLLEADRVIYDRNTSRVSTPRATPG